MGVIDRIAAVYPRSKSVDWIKLEEAMPTQLGVAGEVVLYEHPYHGDEAGIIAYDPARRVAVQTDLHDVSDFQDFMDDPEPDGCDHEWVEGVDEDGELVEPAYDVCVQCGERRD